MINKQRKICPSCRFPNRTHREECLNCGLSLLSLETQSSQQELNEIENIQDARGINETNVTSNNLSQQNLATGATKNRNLRFWLSYGLGFGIVAVLIFFSLIYANWYIYERPKQIEKQSFVSELARNKRIAWLDHAISNNTIVITAIMPKEFREFSQEFIVREGLYGFDNKPDTDEIISDEQIQKAKYLGFEKIEIIRRNLRTGEITIETKNL